MTEREWFAEYDFGEFLNACEWLRDGKKNKRKLLLWGCACCRRLGDLLGDKRSWQAIEAAERKADGLAGKDELNEAREAAKRVPRIRQKLQGTAAEFAASAPVFLLNPSAAEFSSSSVGRGSSVPMPSRRATGVSWLNRCQISICRLRI